MKRIRNKELTVDLPEDWADRSVAAFVLPGPGPVPSSVNLSRSDLLEGQDLTTRTQEYLDQFGETLAGYELIDHTEAVIGVTPATQLLYEWTHPSGRITQLVTIFVRNRTVWTLTATTPSDQLDTTDAMLQQVIQSLVIAPPRAEG